MPEQNRRQTPPQTDEPQRPVGLRKGVAKDAEFSEAAGGPRPAPDPKPRPTGPINKGIDHAKFEESIPDPRPQAPPAPSQRKPRRDKA